MNVRETINFGNITSVESYLEKRCGKSLGYLKEKGVLHLVAEDFANQSISLICGDMPFNNRLILILTDDDSKLQMDPDLIARTIMPILTTYLKEYVQEREVEQIQNEDNQTLNQNRNKIKPIFYSVLTIAGIALSVFAAYRFGSSAN